MTETARVEYVTRYGSIDKANLIVTSEFETDSVSFFLDCVEKKEFSISRNDLERIAQAFLAEVEEGKFNGEENN